MNKLRYHVFILGSTLVCSLVVAALLMFYLDKDSEKNVLQTARIHKAGSNLAHDTFQVDRVATQESGSFRISYQQGIVTIIANQAAKINILQELARVAGFQISISDRYLGRVTLQVENRPIEMVILDLLSTHDITIGYAFDHLLKKHVVSNVFFGIDQVTQQSSELALVDIKDEKNLASKSDSDNATYDKQLPGVLDSDIDEHLNQVVDLEYLMSSVDLDDKKTAIPLLAPQGESLNILIETLENNPDADIREAVVRRLSTGKNFGATKALLTALDDEDLNVVFRAMEGLIGIGDQSLISEIEIRLWDHPNSYVREKVSHMHASIEHRLGVGLDNE